MFSTFARHQKNLSKSLSSVLSRNNATKTPNTQDPGMGWGRVRTGIERIHRVHVETPEYLDIPKSVGVIGAPFTYGQPLYGVDTGPQALREAGLKEGLKRLDWRYAEHGDLKFDRPGRNDALYQGEGKCKNPISVSKANHKIAEACEQHAKLGRFVLTLGGDHSIALGSIAGILQERPDLGVIWVDAHADINTPKTSDSGNMHGMPLAFLAGLEECSDVPGFEWLESVPQFDVSQQLVYVGLRDVDKGEREIIHALNIPAYTMSHVDRYGIGKVMDLALEHLKGRPLHLSYDIDACDPMIAPSTGTTVRGGLTYREAHYVSEACAETRMLGSMDLVEVNPDYHGENGEELGEETVNLGIGLIMSALGTRIL